MIIGVSGKTGSGKDLVGKIIQYHLYMAKEVKGRYYPPDVFINEWDTVDLSEVTNSEIKKYADKLKDIVCLLIGCTREQLEDKEFKEKELGEEWWVYKFPNNQISIYKKDVPDFWQKYLIKLTPRLLLQLLGTECGRQIIHPDIWVNATMEDYKRLPEWIPSGDSVSKEDVSMIRNEEEYPNWIISDVRFPNEADAIKQRGGINIRVERFNSKEGDLIYFKNDSDSSPINGIYKILEVKEDNCTLIDEKTGYTFGAWFEELSKIEEHSSETALDDYNFNYIIDNTEGIDSLIEQVRTILIKEEII